MVIVRSPSAGKSVTQRKDRPINRWISMVRPPILEPRSRDDRVWVARGSMPYSAVTHPLPSIFQKQWHLVLDTGAQIPRVFDLSLSVPTLPRSRAPLLVILQSLSCSGPRPSLRIMFHACLRLKEMWRQLNIRLWHAVNQDILIERPERSSETFRIIVEAAGGGLTLSFNRNTLIFIDK